MNNISLAIPTWNRPKMTLEAFIDVYDMEVVDEIIIVDDASDVDNYTSLKHITDNFTKVKLYRNQSNMDCYFNKKISVELASNKWVCLWDSDNSFGEDYIDQIYKIGNWDNYVALLPSFAMPHFDYRKYEGYEITKQNAHQWASDPTFTTMLNTCNCLVNKEAYLNAWDGNVNPHTADSIYMNYRLLNNGGKIYVVPGLTYNHRVDDHEGEQAGHYGTNHMKTGNFHNEVLQKLKELR